MLGSFTLRRARSAWPLVGCLAVTVLITSVLVAALAGFYTAALPAAVTSELPRSGPMADAVTGGIAGQTPAGVARRLSAAFGAVPARVYPATWTDDLSLPGRSPQAGQPAPGIQAAAVSGITGRARLTAGRWPAAPRAAGPVPAALPAAAAAQLGLHVGSVLAVRDPSSGSRIRLQVSGLYQARQPGDPYWQLDGIGPAGVERDGAFVIYGPAVVSAGAFGRAAAGRLTASQLSAVALPRVAAIPMAGLRPLARSISAADGVFENAGLTADTGMPQLLTDAAAGLATARSLVLISGLQLLLLACAALALASRLLASRREEETALLAARGAARPQLARQALAEAALTAAACAAAGALAGSWLSAALLARLTGLAARPAAPAPAVWLAAAVLALACTAIMTWPSLRPARPGDVRARRGRPARAVAALSAGADIALIVLALLAVRELRGYSATARAAAGAGIDPVVVLAPALALAGLAVVPLRLLPAAARGLERLTARTAGFGSAMANWEISRRPLRQSGPALLVILAVGASTVALAQYQSWRASARDQAAFATGAPVSVQPPGLAETTAAARITALTGVRAATPVSVVPQSGSGQLLVLDAAVAARTVTLRPDLARVPAARLFQSIAVPRRGLVLPGRPARIAVTASVGSAAGGADTALGPVSATLTVQDATGAAYPVQTSAIPADGRAGQLTAALSPAGRAYPLRLIGISLAYTMPAYPAQGAAAAAARPAVLRLDRVAVSPARAGPFPAGAARGAAIASWTAQTSDPGLAFVLSGLGGVSGGSAPPAITAAAAAGGAEQVTFTPGRGPLLTRPPRGTSARPQPGQAGIDLAVPQSQPVPVIATAGYAAAAGLRPGSVFHLTVAGQQVTARLAATVTAFPADGAIVADQAAVQDALADLGAGGDLPATQWWLATAGGVVPAGLPASWPVTDAAARAGRLLSDPLSAAPADAAAAVALAVAVLAGLGFCVSVAAAVRDRRSQRALLGALGVPPRAQRRLFCLEEALIAVPAAAVGLGLGIALGYAMVPVLTVTATGAAPVPPPAVAVPYAWVLPLAAALALVPVIAAAAGTMRQPDPAAELRAAEATA